MTELYPPPPYAPGTRHPEVPIETKQIKTERNRIISRELINKKREFRNLKH